MGARAALCLLVAASSARAGGITNGVEVQASEFPQVVRVELRERSGELACSCTGTAVGPNTVLTAAHCFDELGQSAIKIVVQDGVEHDGIEFLAHPKWDGGEVDRLRARVNQSKPWEAMSPRERIEATKLAKRLLAASGSDLAVVKIGGDASFERYSPVRVHDHAGALARAEVTVVGYGADELSLLGSPGSGPLRRGSNRIATAWEGIIVTTGYWKARAHRRFLRPFRRVLEADGSKAGIGVGDSGGPMLEDGALIGVNVASNFWGDLVSAAFRKMWANGEEIYRTLRSDTMSSNYSVSLSYPENAAFLKSAEALGYRITWAAPPPPRRKAAFKPRSAALELLRAEAEK